MNIKELCDVYFIETLIGYDENITEYDDRLYKEVIVKADDVIKDYEDIFGSEGDRDYEQCNVSLNTLEKYKGKILFLSINEEDDTVTAKTVERKEKVIYVYEDCDGNEEAFTDLNGKEII